MFTPAQLASEIAADPKGLGYAASVAAKNDGAVAALLNQTYAGVGAVWRPALAASVILGCLVASEVAAWTQTQWTAFSCLISTGTVDATTANVRNLFVALMGSAAQSLANLTAAAQVTAPTRAEELWGAGVAVSATDVARAVRAGSL